MNLGRAGEDDGLDAGLFEALGQIGRPMRNLPLLGDLFRARAATSTKEPAKSGAMTDLEKLFK